MTEKPSRYVKGADLQIGDSVSVWWDPDGARVLEIAPYTGRLAYLFPEGATTMKFTAPPHQSRRGWAPMTVDMGTYFKVFDKEARDVQL